MEMMGLGTERILLHTDGRVRFLYRTGYNSTAVQAIPSEDEAVFEESTRKIHTGVSATTQK